MEINVAHSSLLMRLLNELGALTHVLQIERGYTALYIDSRGEIFSDELRAHYAVTDQAIDALEALAREIPDMQAASWAVKIKELSENSAALTQHRDDVQSQSIEFAKAVNVYTYQFIYPVLDVNIEAALNVEGVNPLKVSAFSNFVQWKERAGRERAWGAHGFCSKVFKNKEFTQRMLTLIEEQSAYKRAFMSLATQRQREEVEKNLGGYVMEVLDSIHSQLNDDTQAGDLEALSPITWFELLTGKIDRMYLAQAGLVQGLNPENKRMQTSRVREISPRLERHMPIIQTLPVFSKLDDTALADMLKHADIRTCAKGKLLFMQGETLSRYYLILEGWVETI